MAENARNAPFGRRSHQKGIIPHRTKENAYTGLKMASTGKTETIMTNFDTIQHALQGCKAVNLKALTSSELQYYLNNLQNLLMDAKIEKYKRK